MSDLKSVESLKNELVVLKAMAYDYISQIEYIQKELMSVNQKIADISQKIQSELNK